MARNGSSKVRYAVVGAGNIAQVAILPAFAHAAERSELVAIVSSDEAKRRELGKRYRVSLTAGYEDFERVLASDEIDAVYIALPNNMHCEYTVRAARQGENEPFERLLQLLRCVMHPGLRRLGWRHQHERELDDVRAIGLARTKGQHDGGPGARGKQRRHLIASSHRAEKGQLANPRSTL